jgi:hypothetical protein
VNGWTGGREDGRTGGRQDDRTRKSPTSGHTFVPLPATTTCPRFIASDIILGVRAEMILSGPVPRP